MPRRFRWLLFLPLVLLALLCAAPWLRRPARLHIVRDGFELWALPLPAGLHPRRAVQCAVPGYLQFYEDDELSGQGLYRLHTFRVSPAGLAAEPVREYVRRQQYLQPAWAWPDGRAVLTGAPRALAGGELLQTCDVKQLPLQAAQGLLQRASYAFPGAAPADALVIEGGNLLVLARPSAAAPAGEFSLLRCAADGVARELQVLRGVLSPLLAWEPQAGPVPAVIDQQGQLLRYDPATAQLLSQPAVSGFAQAAGGGGLAMAEDCGLLRIRGGWVAVSADGMARCELSEQSPLLQNPDGSLRSYFQRLPRQLSAARSRAATPEQRQARMLRLLREDYQVWAREGARVPADRAEGTSMAVLVDGATLALLDPVYCRVVLIRRAGGAAAPLQR